MKDLARVWLERRQAFDSVSDHWILPVLRGTASIVEVEVEAAIKAERDVGPMAL
jgi:hypothetical protein